MKLYIHFFLIRVKDPNSSRTVNIGVGFRERETAFDFKSALNEYVRYVDRMALATQMATQVRFHYFFINFIILTLY